MNAAATPPRPPLLSAQDLGFAYAGAAPLLTGLNWTLPAGLSLVCGGEGRGKRTLLRLMAGSLTPTAGRLTRQARTVFHEQVADPAHDAQVARDWLAERQARHADWSEPVSARLAEALGLGEHLDKPLYMLSSGSRRKVGLVAAAASGAALTLVEQPFAALDARSCRVLTELFTEAATNRERAWVLADYAPPASLAHLPWACVVDLGD